MTSENKTPLGDRHAHTPDGRYFVVRGRLWRLSNPQLSEHARARWVKELMSARRAIRDAVDQPDARRLARGRVSKAKHELGERGPPWWSDGSPDYNRKKVVNSPYAAWFAALSGKLIDAPPMSARQHRLVESVSHEGKTKK